MHIESIEIDGIGGIDKLSLNFDRHMNIICGPNGIGKTTILNAITHIGAQAIVQNGKAILKRNVLKDKGEVKLSFGGKDGQLEVNYETASFAPSDVYYRMNNQQDVKNLQKAIFLIRSNRIFNHQTLQSISRDSKTSNYQFVEYCIKGIPIEDTKNWFVNRFLFNGSKSLSETQLQNFKFAQHCFSIANPDIQFDSVLADTFDIMVKTPNGSIYYEYLSSGYKSLISILFSIIKEVEYRFIDKQSIAQDFDGIILIDELEIHFHPEWQTKIVGILRTAFPKAQFIVTTHSPHIIQSAESNEIIALERIGDNVQQREIPQTQNGFKYWTLDEVLTDIMGMQDTNTKEFNDLLDEFNQAIDNEDGEKAREIFAILDASLHPQNYLRKMLKLDMAGLR